MSALRAVLFSRITNLLGWLELALGEFSMVFLFSLWRWRESVRMLAGWFGVHRLASCRLRFGREYQIYISAKVCGMGAPA